jgi:hypothetical protein
MMVEATTAPILDTDGAAPGPATLPGAERDTLEGDALMVRQSGTPKAQGSRAQKRVTPTTGGQSGKRQRPDIGTEYESAWAPEPEAADVWTPRPWVATGIRRTEGQAERKGVLRGSHAAFEVRPGRDPIAILRAQEADRLQDLVPLRHGRMAASPFACYRGTPAVMAFDLAETPPTEIVVQASGDAHISNFGIYASPERQLVFDANDFDETIPGPWEWDVKRLAASVVVAGRGNGFKAAVNRAAVMASVRSYREWMRRYAQMRLIDVWYSGLTESDVRAEILATVSGRSDAAVKRARLDAVFAKARGRDVLKAAASLTTIVDGRLVIKEAPPMLQRVETPGGAAVLAAVFDAYRATMPQGLREFLERYRFADFALKVVGSAASARAVPWSCCRVAMSTIHSSCKPRRPLRPSRSRTFPPAGMRTTASVSSTANASCSRPPTSSWAGAARPPGATSSSASSGT